ncbi:hypothetical protein [Coxiella-like endosymbiont]|uniref:hypothetical protein n=1 Tax=Coxiella-like endosymbiont TaxID=1592897 RepID=UPI00272C9872|nr:hypothetical protein [Coxiella-like endosymbiont]
MEKTTFLNLISIRLTPDSRSIKRFRNTIEVLQFHISSNEKEMISDIFGTNQIIKTIQHINQISVDENNFETVIEYLDIENHIKTFSKIFNLWSIILRNRFYR